MPPEDNHDPKERKNDATAEKPQNGVEKSPSTSEWDGKRLAAAKVPAEWGEGQPNSKGEGWRWANPANKKGDGVRVDKGDPNSDFPSQQQDHVIVRSGGKVLGADGTPIEVKIKNDPDNAHIPLKDWLQWREWNKP
jgi:hypothetical protein